MFNKIIALAWLYLAAIALWPASFWYELRDVYIGSAFQGQPINLLIDREIKRPFVGEWSVTIRKRHDDDKGSVIVCTAEGETDYEPEAALPEPATLDWWTNGRCPTLEVGTYTVSTVLTIQPTLPLIPKKQVAFRSNSFSVFMPQTPS